jgi:hypothetical protein
MAEESGGLTKQQVRTQQWGELQIEDGAKSPRAKVDHRYAKLTPKEADLLQTVDDPPGQMWIWVSSIIGRMANDGQIPAMQTPTYGRIMNIAQNAHSGIRQVRASVCVQTPFIYVHMLASLVHINNIINAVGFGLTLGTLIGTCFMRVKGRKYAGTKDVVNDIENVVVAFFFNFFGPLLYYSLFEVSLTIAQPFSSKRGEIPVAKVLGSLEKDLNNGSFMAANLPGWTAPTFQVKPEKV